MRFAWVELVFGAFLLYTAFKLAFCGEVDPEKNSALNLLRRVRPVTKDYDGSKFFTVENGVRAATPLFAVLLVIETTDLLFAVDSIPAFDFAPQTARNATHRNSQAVNPQMPLKLGVVPYLNPLPLYFSLRERRDIEIVADFPANLGARLENGEFDAALLPVADHIRGIGDGILGDGIVGATRQVRSVLLLSHLEISRIRSVALDTSSHSSVALTRVILRDFYGLTPKFSDHAPDLNAMLKHADAAVLIGDPALVAFQNPAPHRVYDLAALWHQWTGKSFVFAAWIAKSGLENRAELQNLLNQARDTGITQIPEIVAANPVQTALPDAVVESYLREAIQYRLTPAHRAGLDEFARRLRAA